MGMAVVARSAAGIDGTQDGGRRYDEPELLHLVINLQDYRSFI
jgi:hypothetical protein